MTNEQMQALIARLRQFASAVYGHWRNDIDRAADLIESMAQRTNEKDILDVLDWENLRNGAIRALNPANQWAFDRLAQRVPLSEEQVFADDGIMAANARIGIPLSEIMEIVRATESAHGIRSEK